MTGKQTMQNRDEQISAYLDGCLSDADMLAFEADMEREPALAEAVFRWQSNDSTLRQAFDAPIQEPISDEMLARFGLADTPLASNIIDFKSAQNARSERHRARDLVAQWRWPLAGALTASLVAVVTVGTQISNDAPFDIKSSNLFQIAMQDSPSSVQSKIENGQDLSPTLSFIDGSGRYCREFALSGAGTQDSGIACRASDKWQIEAIVKRTHAMPAGGEIHTAGGADVKSLDSVYKRLSASDPLSGNEEKSLITNGWKK
jgi:negative regulator of sigma E activity